MAAVGPRGPGARRTAIAAPAAWAWLVLLASAPEVRAQLSPGPLARAHADLDDASGCRRCHDRTRSIDGLCAECHAEIAWQLDRGEGLHGRERLAECSRCHPDHAGREFDLIDWEGDGPPGFDHARAGWPLRGAHAKTACRSCHAPHLQVAPVAALVHRADRARSWLGLTQVCAACHADRHDGTLGPDCARCHGERAWKPADRFDHAATTYPLTGKHVTVACERCHRPVPEALDHAAEATAVRRFKPLPYAECTGCHADVHAGRLGPACATCHATDDFRAVERERFDHDRTRYPLRGKHRAVACERCHDKRHAGGPHPPSARCDACHRDAHAGGARLAGRPADCSACHDVEGFAPSTLSVADHEHTAYPLVDRHRQVACDACHPKVSAEDGGSELGSSRVRLRPLHAACRDCHADAHGGQLAATPDGVGCEPCHGVAGWKPSTFGVVRHAATALPLEGRHATAPCAGCHRPAAGATAAATPNDAGVVLVGLPVACAGCHIDPHVGRFSADGERPHEGGCRACHGLEAFRPSAVDAEMHRRFAYPLEGAHRTTICLDCHDPLRAPAAAGPHLLSAGGTARDLTFRAGFAGCAACHDTPHGEQFADRPGGAACDTCHDVRTFRPAARFDHDRDSGFRLDRAHADVRCSSCHPREPAADGTEIVRYRPLARECAACHAPRHGARS